MLDVLFCGLKVFPVAWIALYEGLWISKLIKKKIKNFVSCIFQFLVIKTLDPDQPVLDSQHFSEGRVSDPHRFNADPDTDPDPAFFLIADPDSGSGFRIRIPDPDPGSGSRIWIQDLMI